MAKKILSDFECRFLARTYVARKLRYATQEEFAPFLKTGMEQDTYKQYESRSSLPHELVGKFLKLTGVSYEWLFEGKGAGPEWVERYQELLAKQQRLKKVRKAA